MRRAIALLFFTSLIGVACLLPEPNYVGRGCTEDSECPDEMQCLVNPQYSGRFCQSRSIRYVEGDAGVAFYCDGAKPVLDTYCVSCHGDVPTNLAPSTFRLDLFDTTNKPGAQAQADRAAFRAYQLRDMPPRTAPQQPSDAERRTLYAWASSGAELCAPDAGPGGGGGGSPPTVTLDNPPAGAQLYVSAATDGIVTLVASAADPGGSVAKVEFYRGTTKLGEDTTAPYSFEWAVTGTGSASLTAKAIDNAGLETTSAPRNVTVSATPAGQTVWSLALLDAATKAVLREPIPNNAVYSKASLGVADVALRANVFNVTGSVSFAITGQAVANENTPPFCIGAAVDCNAAPMLSGVIAITSTPYDMDGALGTAGTAHTVSLTINN